MSNSGAPSPICIQPHPYTHHFTIPVEFREYDFVEDYKGAVPKAKKIEVTKLRCVCGKERERE